MTIMRKYILPLLAGTASIALAAQAASAADLPVRAAPPAPVIAAVPVFTWTGFYIGANAGVGWNTNSNNEILYLPDVGYISPSSGDDAVFVGGGQIGYNYQIGQFVIGAEADLQWADVGNRFGSSSNDWFGTVRAKAGVAVDQFLIYATGGFAYSDNPTGWTVGGGVEWALPVNWFGSSAVTIGVEGLYVNLDLDNDNRFINNVALGGGNDELEFAVVRAKLNFKFGTY
jgi:outer membrane immunogenic protein